MILPIERPLIALDVETHAFGIPETLRIIELGFHIEYPAVSMLPPKRWVSLVDPGLPITREATGEHHITNEMIKGCKLCSENRDHEGVHVPWPTFLYLAPRLAKGFSNCDFCGYNVRFDIRVLSGEFERAKMPWTVGNARLLDASALWRVAVPRTLSDAVREFLGREPTSAHRALGDAEDALEVALAQLERWPKLPRDLAKLHDLCFDSKNVDPDGKFIWVNGEIVCNFGKHGRTNLKAMPRGYLEWMVTAGDFSSDVKKLVTDALNDIYPVRL